MPTILGELKRHFRDRGWSVRVPRDLQELAVSVEPVSEELARELGRAPTPAEIAKRTGTTVEQVLEAREAAGAYRAVSLDRPREDDEDGDGLGDGLGIEDRASAVAEDAATVERLMRVLNEREREVLRLRFAEDLTQAEIGDRVGVSQMHVSRIIRQAVSRLRAAAEESESEGYAPGMEHWDLRSLDVEPHQPRILHSARGEARSILINLPAGEALQDHQVHERAYVVVIDGEVELAAATRARRVGLRSSTPPSATRSRRRATPACCWCSRHGRETATPAQEIEARHPLRPTPIIRPESG